MKTKREHLKEHLKRRRPVKPYPDFPLFPHRGGQWVKKIRGRNHYFGVWADPNAALERYLQARDHLLAGVIPPNTRGCSLDELVNRFLVHQLARFEAGDISRRQYNDYVREGKTILDCLGRVVTVEQLTPESFARLRLRATRSNATTATNIIVRQRSIFKWAYTAGLIDKPVNYGGAFDLPSAKLRRKALRKSGPKDLTAPQILKLLDAAQEAKWGQLLPLRAMILLGINCGLGNTDCGMMEDKHLVGDILDFPLPKTGEDRRGILWPETLSALSEARLRRPKGVPDEIKDRVFVTKRLQAYTHESPAGKPVDSVGLEFRRLAIQCGVHRPGIGFYSLRHTFQTVADETKDFPAISLMMGHQQEGMAARYRERISDDRLRAVAEYVRKWLFGLK